MIIEYLQESNRDRLKQILSELNETTRLITEATMRLTRYAFILHAFIYIYRTKKIRNKFSAARHSSRSHFEQETLLRRNNFGDGPNSWRQTQRSGSIEQSFKTISMNFQPDGGRFKKYGSMANLRFKRPEVTIEMNHTRHEDKMATKRNHCETSR